MEGGKEAEKSKSFLRRHELPIIIVLTLFFIYVVVFLNQKVNFFLGNELIVYLSPGQRAMNMHYSNSSFVSFDVSIENSANCRALCEYNFYDRSRNTALDYGEFRISRGEHVLRNYTLFAKRTGSGQDIYSFDVECKSIASIICLTSSPRTQRSSFVTVNYDLSEEEKQLKQSLKNEIASILNELKEADESFQRLSQRYFELGKKINLEEISGDKTKVENELNKIILDIEAIRSQWSLEDYRKIDSMLDDSFLEKARGIKDSIEMLNGRIDSALKEHNEMLKFIELFSGKINLTSRNANAIGKNDEYNISALVLEFNRISNEITNNTFENYSSASAEINELNRETNSAISQMQPEVFSLFNQINYFTEYESRLLCNLSKCSPESRIYGEARNFLQNYPDVKLKCEGLESLKEKFANISANKVFPNPQEFFDNASLVYENKKRFLNNTIIDEFKVEIIPDEIRSSFSLIIPKNYSNISEINETAEINDYLLSIINFSDAGKYDEVNGACMRYSNPAYKIQSFDFSHVADEINYTIFERINATLPENPPLCCVFNECNPCCTNEECKSQNYPVIFLHGHSFSSDNSPEFSLDAFNKVQSRMQEDGYINAGIVSVTSKNENNNGGAWGISGKPVTVKASYYYDSIIQDDEYVIVPTKSESIDTYALRLKDIIDVVKQRTGKDKVNIVAHSMGGLVARKYLQIFGDNDVDRLVMIATPNRGISGRATDFCSFAGENLECRDMSKNSIFISKLNDPSKQPKDAVIFNVIGTGCKMKGGDGDGVVIVSDVEMQNANNFYIEGKCTGLFGENLHTDLLNIDKYNATYSIIKNALQS